ncbi:MFS transporter [Kribbella turkmenica]|uniref:MFS transporter n=1 Tax=Kribbella turkmenica TaxID=2530375 RepID=A0A4R4WDY7_9ACTN|nr:MFS transporter [Kribbella turkmenica]TDD17149.1 MFS transporter [Kribbella turkmenica]
MSSATKVPPSPTKRVLVAGGVGNFVEWYDFTIYGFSVGIVASVYFPKGNPTAALLAAFAVYGVAFAARPLGALFFGSIGDRLGRRNALAAAILLMAISTAMVGILPTYNSIGVVAPVLLVIARLAQGFSAGGEFSGVATFVFEHASPRRRGTWVAGVSVFALVGMGSAAVTVLAFSLAYPTEYKAWAWRIPFILGALVALVGLYLRLRLDETPVFRALEASNQINKTPLRDAFRMHGRELCLLFCAFSYQAVAGHSIIGYLPTYLHEQVGMKTTTALMIAGFTMLVGAAIGLSMGRISDTVGRRPVVIAALASAAVLTIPAFLIIHAGAGLAGGVVAEILLVAPFATILGAMMPTMMELMSPAVRYSAAAVGYNLPYMIFGGSAPFVAALLVSWTGSGLSPAIYITVVAVVALVAITAWLPETHRVGETNPDTGSAVSPLHGDAVP